MVRCDCMCIQVLCHDASDCMCVVYIFKIQSAILIFVWDVCVPSVLHGEHMPVAGA